MGIGFSYTLEYRTNKSITADVLGNLPAAIRRHTDWNYTCEQTDSGCLLKPVFRDMPYRNSFVPEIDVAVSCDDGQSVLCMRGQPVKMVRFFSAFWLGVVLLMQVFVVALAFASKLNGLFPLFLPAIMFFLGYFLCKISSKRVFTSIVKAIQQEIG
ncbi:MAG: hypothetical protein IJN53_03675 [Oscillospiraceae bacterium]|nr:hypothetical protein [Oscillospiraceae bacterium]